MQRPIGSKSARVWLARALVALLLIVQGLVAVHACPPGIDGVGHALAVPSEPATDHAGCHDQGPMPADANLCLAHCTSGDENTQSADRSPLSVPALAGGPLLSIARRPMPEFPLHDAAPAPCSDPSIPIRFCVFRS